MYSAMLVPCDISALSGGGGGGTGIPSADTAADDDEEDDFADAGRDGLPPKLKCASGGGGGMAPFDAAMAVGTGGAGAMCVRVCMCE